MTGARILEILRESHAAVLRKHGVHGANSIIEEMARNAAAILSAEIEAEQAETEEQALLRELAALPDGASLEMRAALGVGGGS